MKISELSAISQVPVPTIKFYIRQGLVPAGNRTSKNQADYESSHVERLALIRALQEAGGLRLDTIARALHAADSAKEDFVIAAVDALERPAQVPVDTKSESYQRAQRMMLATIERRGWQLSADDVSVRDAIQALSVAGQTFSDENESVIAPYAEAADMLARHEIPDDWEPDASKDAALRYAMLGTVLLEPVILAMRRMAHVARTRSAKNRSKT